MAKLPAIQFYPGDWLQDNVSSCSLAAQGLWLRMMMMMHRNEEYGYLSISGKPMPISMIVKGTGCENENQYSDLLSELFLAGVPEKTSEGLVFSRRLVRDHKARKNNALRVKKHRKSPGVTPLKQKSNGDVTKMYTPASSSSSSSSSLKEIIDSHISVLGSEEYAGWLEVVCMKLRNKANPVLGHLRKFLMDNSTEESLKRPISEIQRHFTNWCNMHPIGKVDASGSTSYGLKTISHD
jgi:hypothetical protein